MVVAIEILLCTFDVLIDVCARYYAFVDAGCTELEFGIVLLDAGVELVCLSLLVLLLEDTGSLHEVHGGETGILCLLGGFLELLDCLVELVVASVAIAEGCDAIGGDGAVVLGRELFELLDGLLVFALVVVADTSLKAGDVGSVGKGVFFCNLEETLEGVLALYGITVEGLVPLLLSVELGAESKLGLCSVFAVVHPGVDAEPCECDDDNCGEADDDLLLVLIDEFFGFGLCHFDIK